MRLLRHLVTIGVVASAFAVTATACSTREFAGFVREPAPDVSALSLPDTSTGAEFTLTAPPGGLLMVYFGYTNCPDYCPTTMSELRIALRRAGDPDQVAVAMVTVDPDRDGPISPQHYAFLVSEEEFTAIMARIEARGMQFWADPARSKPGEINTNDGGRGVYFEGPDGHFFEALTMPYGSGT